MQIQRISPIEVIGITIGTFYGVFLGYMLQLSAGISGAATSFQIYESFYNSSLSLSTNQIHFQEYAYRSAYLIVVGIIMGVAVLGLFAALCLRSSRETKLATKTLFAWSAFLLFLEPILTVITSWGSPFVFGFENSISAEPAVRVTFSGIVTVIDSGIFTSGAFLESQVSLLAIMLLIGSLRFLNRGVGWRRKVVGVMLVAGALILSIPVEQAIINIGGPGRFITILDSLNGVFGGYSFFGLFVPWLFWLMSIGGTYWPHRVRNRQRPESPREGHG